jgi:serine protein kinase
MAELIGSANLATVDYYGNEGDVRAYAFNGELHTANRGIMEFIEVLKAKSDFLHVLLTLAEEQQFKTPRFPLQYVDETLIAHTNEGEFYRFISVKENEAIVDRLYIVRVPYNMQVENEEKIYHFALKTKLVVKDVTVHPGAVRLASMFAIATRQHDDPLRNGMQGISPRFILNTLAIAMVRINGKVVTPKDMVNVLRHQVYNYPVLGLETRKQYLHYLDQLETKVPMLNELKSENVKFKVKQEKKGMFDLMIGDDD